MGPADSSRRYSGGSSACEERALIHVAVPKGAGKTTFIERVLGGSAGDWMLAALIRDDSLRRSCESAPKARGELQLDHDGGATGAALFEFLEQQRFGFIFHDAFRSI